MKNTAQKFRKSKLNSQRGMTNIQIAIGIMVGVVAILGAIGGYKYINNAKVNNDFTVLSDLKSNTVKYGQAVGTFTTSNSSLATLIGLNFFNNPLLTTTATSVTDQWGGALTVAVGTAANAGDSLVFTFNNIPSEACTEIALRVDPLAAAVSINGTATKAVGASSVPATVATQCASSSNSIAYTLTR